MDGYSVQEAASVLGVAEGRVWELLARGVLSGTPEGDSMRVFFKAQPGPIATAGSREEAPRTNGNGGSHDAAGEASAFRELLTEFRNLTERYGQALLALGEARGEVAGLRSRVDQLEARLDLRLPPPIEAAPVAWESATIPASTPEPASAAPPERPAAPRPKPARPKPARPKPRPRKAHSSREAVEGFAGALARAQDPNPADLGPSPDQEASATPDLEPMTAAVADVGEAAEIVEPMEDQAAPAEVAAEEVAAPEAISEADLVAAVAVAEVSAPEAIAGADEVAEEVVAEDLVAEEAVSEDVASGAASEPAEETADETAATAPAGAEAPTYSAVVVEPDWFADGDFAWLDAADMEATTAAEAAKAPPEPVAAAEDLEGMASEVQPAPGVSAAVTEPEPPTAVSAAAAEPPVEPQAEPFAEQLADEQAVPSAAEPEFVQQAQSIPEPMLETPAEPESVPVFEAEAEFEAWQPPEPAVTEHADSDVADSDVSDSDVADAGIDPGIVDTGSQGAEDAQSGRLDAGPGGRPEPQTMRSAIAVEELEEEVMWLGAAPTPIVQDEPRPELRTEAEAWPAVDIVPSPTDVTRPPLAMTEDELARLALDEGWDEAEVAAIRAMITPVPGAPVDLPGAAELHEAMAALEAVPVRIDPAFDPKRQWAKPAPEDHEPVRQDDWAFEAEPAAPPTATQRPPTDVTSALRRSAADPGWLRRRQGPAAAAYRRLRRLFPG